VLLRMLERGLGSPACTSMGRLFDGLAALLCLCEENTHEARSAQALEFAAGRPPGEEAEPLEFSWEDGDVLQLDWHPMVREVVEGRQDPEAAPAFAHRIHATLIAAAADLAQRLDLHRLGATGGCFQNRILMEGLGAALAEDGRELVVPRVLPVNDGGLALGQLWIAAQRVHG